MEQQQQALMHLLQQADSIGQQAVQAGLHLASSATFAGLLLQLWQHC
jgi:hypothetical protein